MKAACIIIIIHHDHSSSSTSVRAAFGANEWEQQSIGAGDVIACCVEKHTYSTIVGSEKADVLIRAKNA